MTTLIIATRNPHKVGEIRDILGDGFEYRTLSDHPGAPTAVEDGSTFAENAVKKAESLAAWLRGSVESGKRKAEGGKDETFVLADDSGLEVDALNGAPGVHSARFAALDAPTAGNSKDADNNAKLLRLLRDVPVTDRTARFRCVIALVPVTQHSSPLTPHVFDGACEGHIEFAPRGQGGFGYDPLFIPEGFDRSFAELGDAEKNRISHRSRALAKLREWLEAQRSVIA